LKTDLSITCEVILKALKKVRLEEDGLQFIENHPEPKAAPAAVAVTYRVLMVPLRRQPENGTVFSRAGAGVCMAIDLR